MNMETLDADTESLTGQVNSTAYTLTLEGASEMASASEELGPLSGGGELSDDTSKDLPRLIIQEQLEERTPTSGDPEDQSGYQEQGKNVSSMKVCDDGQNMEVNKEDSSQGSRDEKRQPGYVILNSSERPVNMSSDVTPLLVLAYNTDKGMYEANVVLGRTAGGSPSIKSTELDGASECESDSRITTEVEESDVNIVSGENTQYVMEGNQQAGQLLYLCGIDQCDVVCPSLEDIQQHQTSHSDQDKNLMSQNGEHQTASTMERNLSCPYRGCGRKFAWPAHLKYHLLTHTGKRMFACEEEGCGATFYTVQRLTVHRRVHTGEKPFVCPEKGCKKAFTTQGNLKNHLRIHSGERPFGCDVPGCGRRFAEQSSLRKHSLVHSGKKPYECEICGKRFSQSGSKNVHVNRHKTTSAVAKAVELKCDQKNGETMVVKLQGDNLLVLQQTPEESLQYQDLPTSESVVFSNAVTDHVVTITTQPADGDLDAINQENLLKIDDHVKADVASSSPALSTPTTGANVVVLSQPEEMVAMAPGYHHDPGRGAEEMVYTGHTLLNVDMT